MVTKVNHVSSRPTISHSPQSPLSLVVAINHCNQSITRHPQSLHCFQPDSHAFPLFEPPTVWMSNVISHDESITLQKQSPFRVIHSQPLGPRHHEVETISSRLKSSTPFFGILNSAFFSKLTSHIPDPERTSLFGILVILASNHSRDLTCSSEPPRASNYPEPPDLDSNNFVIHSRDQHPSKNKLFFKINPRIRRRLLFFFFLVSVVKLDSNRQREKLREAYAFHLTGTFETGSIIYVKHCSRVFQLD